MISLFRLFNFQRVSKQPATPSQKLFNQQPIATVHGTSKAGFHPVAGADVIAVGRRFGGKGGNASGLRGRR